MCCVLYCMCVVLCFVLYVCRVLYVCCVFYLWTTVPIPCRESQYWRLLKNSFKTKFYKEALIIEQHYFARQKLMFFRYTMDISLLCFWSVKVKGLEPIILVLHETNVLSKYHGRIFFAFLVRKGNRYTAILFLRQVPMSLLVLSVLAQ